MTLRQLLPSIALSALAVSGAQAQIIIKDDSSPVSVSEITNYETDFNMVGGMKVSWTLTGGSSSAFWGSLAGVTANSIAAPAGSWGVWTDDFKLWGNGSTDTFGNNVWSLWARNLTSFTLEALPGNGVFDLSSPNTGTEGSSSGKTFNWDDDVDSRVTYSNPIGVHPDVPVGDLYGTLKVEFGKMTDACPAGWSLYNGSCKQWTGSYSCPSGYTLYNTDDCKKWYNNRWNYTDASKVYQYQDPIEVWEPITFGTSNKCSNAYSPTVNQSGNGDNTKCWEKFSQDMDNALVLTPGTTSEVVPEPATMTLLATGLAGMAAARRRRRKS